MRCALVNVASGIVENLIVADPKTDPAPDGYLLLGDLPDWVDIGGEYKDGAFVEPPPPPDVIPKVEGLDTI